MSDPLRTDGSRTLDAASDAERDAKIEQLLLVGLDHYFASQHEQAINVWTRALFLDRSHPKARAYIERARSALAERQRQSEELLHSGVEALRRGEGGEARRLIQAAIDSGAPSDEAFAALDRLDRLEQPPAPPRRDRSPDETRRTATPRVAGATSRTALGLALSLALVLAIVVAGAYLGANWDRFAEGVAPGVDRVPAAAAPIARDPGLPLPRRGEMALVRARKLTSTGHLHDALSVLDAIRATDPQKAEADRLRSDIQHQLLGLVATGKAERRLP